MTITRQIYDTQDLLGVLRYLPPPNNYWLDLVFKREFQSTSQWIEMEKIVKYKKIAPYVMPMVQGRPIFKESTSLTRLKPAYIKPKDPINPVEMLGRRPGSMLSATPPTPQQNYDAAVAAIQQEHRDAIARRWEVMAARAVIDGYIVLEGEDYPAVRVDFGRDSEQTVTLGVGARWGEVGVDIIQDIEDWRKIMRNKPFAGPVNRLTMGADAWGAFRADDKVFKTLNTLTRGTTSDIKVLDPLGGALVEYVGRLSDLELYVYSDFYQQDDGTSVSLMSAKDVVLTGPNIDGVRAFGAILDKKASFQPLSIFPKMWDEDDPPATFLMSQSAPLMIPVNPNNTFKATVVA